MATAANPSSTPAKDRPIGAARRVRNFWERVTEGLAVDQLWGQFKSEAQATYGLYSKDVDWEEIRREEKSWKRPFLGAWALFQAMLMKLSPARRVLLLLALVFLVFSMNVGSGGQRVSVDFGSLGVIILFVLLALELGDRVTMKRDLEIAREIQLWLVPSVPPVIAGADIAFATRPQNTVAGDYFDAFLRTATSEEPDPHRLIVAVADVAGKSVPAALLMATFQASLHALSATMASLEQIALGLDRYARAHSLEGRRFTTAFLAQIDPETREMVYVNAGHNDPILRRASGQIERLNAGGPPFGLPLFSDTATMYLSERVQLAAGDLLFIFTDGVIEAVNEVGEEYGEARLRSSLETAPAVPAGEILKRVMTEVNTFVGYARQHDDITCLVLRMV
jgi:phosphoserine phosphatase RsbU/P